MRWKPREWALVGVLLLAMPWTLAKMTDVAFALSPGQTSQVVQIGDSFYILYCESKKDSGVIPLPEVRDGIQKKLEQAQRQKATQRWLDSLREKAFIKIY